jgi:hypothetical protein
VAGDGEFGGSLVPATPVQSTIRRATLHCAGLGRSGADPLLRVDASLILCRAERKRATSDGERRPREFRWSLLIDRGSGRLPASARSPPIDRQRCTTSCATSSVAA